MIHHVRKFSSSNAVNELMVKEHEIVHCFKTFCVLEFLIIEKRIRYNDYNTA